MNPPTGLLTDIRRLKKLFDALSIKLSLLCIPALFGVCASIFEVISVALLIPLVNNIIYLETGLNKKGPVIGSLLSLLPDELTTGRHVFMALAGMVFMAAIIKHIFQYSSATTAARIVRRLADALRRLIFSRYLTFGKLFFDKNSTGHLFEILVTCSQRIAAHLMQLQTIFSNFFLLIAYLAILFWVSWELTLCSIIIFPVLNYSLNWLVGKIKRTSSDYAVQQKELGKKMFDVLSSILLVKAYNAENKEKTVFGKTSEKVRLYEYSMDKKINLITPLQEIIMLFVMLALICFMAYMVALGAGAEVVASYLVYFYVLRRATLSFGVLNNMKAYLAALSGPLDLIEDVLKDDKKPFTEDGTQSFDGLQNAIEFDNVAFSYADNRNVLKDITFKIERKKMIAIVGPTGSGKSTLVHLLARFYDPTEGQIRIDDVDIQKFTLRSLRDKMAIVSQDAQLFNESIKKNLIYGLEKNVSDKELEEVVKQARLYDFIMQLPLKFETRVGDRGVQLSGGERQRVSIARALLKNAEILILDEATSSLDSKTEKLIQCAIEELVVEKTTIVIAHRLSTIKNADKVIVMENGRIVEQGAPNELIRKKGQFWEHWMEQKNI